jgi:hypothetical protein
LERQRCFLMFMAQPPVGGRCGAVHRSCDQSCVRAVCKPALLFPCLRTGADCVAAVGTCTHLIGNRGIRLCISLVCRLAIYTKITLCSNYSTD